MYRRRQRLYVEMEQMANRAFSQVLVEIERRDLTSDSDSETNSARKKKKVLNYNILQMFTEKIIWKIILKYLNQSFF